MSITMIKTPNKRRIAKAHHVWKHNSRPRTVRRASLRWMRYVGLVRKTPEEVAA